MPHSWPNPPGICNRTLQSSECGTEYFSLIVLLFLHSPQLQSVLLSSLHLARRNKWCTTEFMFVLLVTVKYCWEVIVHHDADSVQTKQSPVMENVTSFLFAFTPYLLKLNKLFGWAVICTANIANKGLLLLYWEISCLKNSSTNIKQKTLLEMIHFTKSDQYKC